MTHCYVVLFIKPNSLRTNILPWQVAKHFTSLFQVLIIRQFCPVPTIRPLCPVPTIRPLCPVPTIRPLGRLLITKTLGPITNYWEI